MKELSAGAEWIVVGGMIASVGLWSHKVEESSTQISCGGERCFVRKWMKDSLLMLTRLEENLEKAQG